MYETHVQTNLFCVFAFIFVFFVNHREKNQFLFLLFPLYICYHVNKSNENTKTDNVLPHNSIYKKFNNSLKSSAQ